MEDTMPIAAPQAPVEHREAYGTAKTENLSDSGLWRVLLPLVVLGCCAALIATPLIFLVPSLIRSFDGTNAANMQGTPLSWVWIVLIGLVAIIDAVVIRGLGKIFFTQAGNYR